MCDAALQLDLPAIQTAFGVRDVKDLAQDFSGISIDSL
jgi:hypothetical protein